MTQDTRRRLISLLDQYPMARESYLYDGRRQVAPREDFADKIEALFASSYGTSELQQRMEGSRPLRERYEDALEVVRKQALIIEDLEAKASIFQQVMQASEHYVKRFGGVLSEEGAIKKIDEEVWEFKFSITDSTPDLIISDEGRLMIAGELIDAIVTLGGLASYAGIQWEDIEQAARETLDKLDSRTAETHAWSDDTKTVERIGKEVKP